MKTIARENGRYSIRCNVVCPASPCRKAKTKSVRQHVDDNSFFTPDQYEKIAKSLPLRRLGRAEDTANAVVFLASPAAGYITGQVLSVSGGYTMIG